MTRTHEARQRGRAAKWQKTVRATVRHARVPSRWRSAGIPALKGTAIALTVLLVSGFSVTALGVWQFSKELSDNALDILGGGDGESFAGGFNALLVGVDNAPDQGSAFGERGSTLNDVTMLLHVSSDHKSGVVVSFPRDLMVRQPECTNRETGAVSSAVSHQQINAAFSRGGLSCVVSTVRQLTGLSIPFAGVITFRGTVAMADAVGGVPICVKSRVVDRKSGLDLPAGISTVSGREALAFLRSREGLGDGSDLSRISSQQAYLSSLIRQMKRSATLTNIPRLIELARVAASNLKLSRSLASVPTLVRMAMALNDIPLDKLAFVHFPTVPDPANPNRVVPSDRLAKRLVAAMKADQSITLEADSRDGDASLDSSPSPSPGRSTSRPSHATSSPPSGGATPAPDSRKRPSIDGLRGQSASEQTCSVS